MKDLNEFDMHVEDEVATATLPLEPFYTIGDLKRLLRVSERSIHRHVKAGHFPAPVRIGGVNRWRPEAVRSHLENLK